MGVGDLVKVMPTVSVKLTGEQAQVIIDVLVREVQNVRATMEVEHKFGGTLMFNDISPELREELLGAVKWEEGK